jgi:5-(carboxyamino)imidazole ribonucleotide synthase
MKKAGILGGGQLGRMLLQAAVNYPVETYLMENEENAPAAHLCHHFTKGDITRFEDVYDFGKHLDFLTIEIENVNLEALEKLSEEGVIVYPNPAALKIIKNKIQQKQFYVEHNIPTSAFVVTHSIEELKNNVHLFPAVHKVSNGGYDGKGVQIIRNIEDELSNFCKNVSFFNEEGLRNQIKSMKHGNKDYTNNLWTIYFIIQWFKKWM